MKMTNETPPAGRRDPDERGYFGAYGGGFVPETLVAPVEELKEAYFDARMDAGFREDFERLLQHYVGRPPRSTRRSAGRERSAGHGSF